MNVPFHKPQIDEDDIQAVVETLRSGWVTTGPAVKRFEETFAEYVGAQHAIAVNSCTAAMHLSLAALGVGPGDEVLTSPYTFVATAEAIQYLGARPVLVDVCEHDCNLDPVALEKTLAASANNGAHVKAVMPVHIAGHPCDMNAIRDLARKYDVAVVEDAAHCLEGQVRVAGAWEKIGAVSEATCFSFYATKNITTGEGGMVTTNRDDLAQRIRTLCLHGMSRDAWKRYSAEGSWYYEIVARGYKYNMPDILAALGLSQMSKAEEMFERRREYAAFLLGELADVEEIILPEASPEVVHAWHLFMIRLRPERLTLTRSAFIEALKRAGVHASVHFIPLHLHPFFQERFGYAAGDFPVAERIYESVLSLPFYPAMTVEQLRYVARTVKETIRQHRRTGQVPVVQAA